MSILRTPLAVGLVSAAAALLSAAPRVLLAADQLPSWLRPFTWSDVYVTYVLRGLADGRLPYRDAFFEYPPGIGYTSAAIALITQGAALYVAAWAALIALAAGALGYVLAREAGSRRALVFWALSPQLLLYSGMNFDVVPTALIAGAAIAARRGRDTTTALLLAAGMVVKLFPAVAAPLVAVRMAHASGWHRAGRWATVFAVTVLAVCLPAILAPYSALLSFAFVGYRTNFDSIWGLLVTGLSRLGVAEAGFSTPIVGALVAVGLGVTYVAVLGRSRGLRDPAVGFCLVLIALLLWTRLYSPQFSLWVLPFFALLRIPVRFFVALCAADLTTYASLFPLTLGEPPIGSLPDLLRTPLLVIGVIGRHLALLWIALRLASATSIDGAVPRRATTP